jgi:hypothetical protein
VLTWKAGTYAPTGFTGKLLPSSESLVAVALSAFRNNRTIPLDKQLVRWYLNDQLISSGVGMTTFMTASPNLPGGDFSIKAELPNLPENSAVRSITIPNISPRIVLRPEAAISSLRKFPFLLRSEPYFFNITNPAELKFDWQVNGSPIMSNENPDWLRLSLPQGRTELPTVINISLRASRGDSILETASLQTALHPGIAQ